MVCIGMRPAHIPIPSGAHIMEPENLLLPDGVMVFPGLRYFLAGSTLSVFGSCVGNQHWWGLLYGLTGWCDGILAFLAWA